MNSGEEINLSYSALFQNIKIKLKHYPGDQFDTVICEAEVKLPVLKKTFVTKTIFKKNTFDWVVHYPIAEAIDESKVVNKDSSNEHAQDPIGFFIKLHAQKWDLDHVEMLVGKKVVRFDVGHTAGIYEIRREEKNQKLWVKTHPSEGIQSVELPVPMLGNLSVRRT